jgi:hypothetical protein
MITIEIDVQDVKELYEDLTPRRIAIALRRAVKRLSPLAIEYASQPTEGWDHDVSFLVRPNVHAGSDEASLEISTDDEIYNWIDKGTPPHKIVAKRGKSLKFLGEPNKMYQPKTMPYSLASQELIYEGTEIQPAYVMHPGVEAREFGPEILMYLYPDMVPIVREELSAAWSRQQNYRPR